MSDLTKNIIELKIDKTLTVLSGNPFGQSEFESQIKEHFDKDNINVIVIPPQINDVAASFIQGFFKWVIDTMGVDGFFKHVRIQSDNEDLVQKIYDSIY